MKSHVTVSITTNSVKFWNLITTHINYRLASWPTSQPTINYSKGGMIRVMWPLLNFGSPSITQP